MQDGHENETIQFVMECSVQLNKNYELPTFHQVVCWYYGNRWQSDTTLLKQLSHEQKFLTRGFRSPENERRIQYIHTCE